MMQAVFVIVEFKILNIFAVITNHLFSQYLASLSLENLIFLVAMYLYVFQINHKPSGPQMGVTKMHF